MLRTVLFAGAFPLFNNVDEAFHIDLVVKRAMGLPTRPNEPIGEATRDLELRYGTGLGLDGREIRFYWSPEYTDPRPPTGGVPVPFWKAPLTVQSAFEARAKAIWPTRPNHEAFEPPLYYVIAAWWARLGGLLGAREAAVLYWVRAMDAVLAGGLVVVAAAFGRLCDSTSRAFRLGLPLLVAAIPQKALYSITNDALSPLVGGVATWAGLRLLLADRARARDAVLGGVAIGLALATKLTNVLLLAMLPMIVVARARRGGPAEAGRSAGWLVVAIAVPLAIWRVTEGHSAFRPEAKAAALGWTYRPLVELVEHPILTAGGAWYFVSELLTTFWRGELTWHGTPLGLPAMDAVYVVVSLALLGAAAARLLREWRPPVRGAVLMSLAVFGAGVLMLAVLSTRFDFGDFHYPSRASPYFVSGRLIGAALLAFATLFVYGLEGLVARTRLRGREVLVVLAFATVVTATELTLSIGAIRSPYNWFHLR